MCSCLAYTLGCVELKQTSWLDRVSQTGYCKAVSLCEVQYFSPSFDLAWHVTRDVVRQHIALNMILVNVHSWTETCKGTDS